MNTVSNIIVYYIIMAEAIKHSSKMLNQTLVFFANLLHTHGIYNWFIGYGTLLGIVRNNSCIDGDDDVDIIIDKKYYQQIMDILSNNNIETWNPVRFGPSFKHNIIKTFNSDIFASVDFYCADVNDNWDFHDTWEQLVWSNCHTEKEQFILYDWNGTGLNVPHNYETKLIKTYGEDWRTPLSRGNYVSAKTRNIDTL